MSAKYLKIDPLTEFNMHYGQEIVHQLQLGPKTKYNSLHIINYKEKFI